MPRTPCGGAFFFFARCLMSKSRGGSSKTTAGKPDGVPAESAASLDKVRDILFGEQTRLSEQKFEQLGTKLSEGLSRADQRQDAAIAALSKKLEDVVQSMQAAAKSGASEQADQLRAVETQLAGRQAELESELGAVQDKLRAEADAQHEALRADLRAVQTEQAAATQALADELRGAMTDRARLAGLFRGLADALASSD